MPTCTTYHHHYKLKSTVFVNLNFTCSLAPHITHITVCIGANSLYWSFSTVIVYTYTCISFYNHKYITIVHSRNTRGEPELIILWQYNVAQYIAFAYNMSQQCMPVMSLLNIKQLAHRHYRSLLFHLRRYEYHKTKVPSAHWSFHTWQVVGQLQLYMYLLSRFSLSMTYLSSFRSLNNHTHT